jgi:hypothetical protein
VTLNFNNDMSTVAVFLEIEKAFGTTWQFGLRYKLSKLQFSTNLIKLIGSRGGLCSEEDPAWARLYGGLL